MISLSVAEARSRFSELISRAASGERFVIERRLRPVAVVLGAAELAQLERGAELEPVGAPVGDLDLQIASIALEHAATLVSHNRRRFERIVGLALEDWLAA